MVTKTFDSTLAYYVNQLDNLDRRLYQPLTNVTWNRDIKLRSGITMANESTSFVRSAFAGTGTNNNNGKPWLSANTTSLPGIDINGERVVLPLRLAGSEISYTSVELERSQLLGQPLDVTKLDALNVMYNMAVDEMVYIGDSDLGVKGLTNSALVSSGSVANDGTGSATFWTTKTPDQILRDVNEMLYASYAASAFAVCPSELRLPPAQFGYIASQKVSTAGNVSILQFLEDNSLSLRINGKKLNIQPLKWLTGTTNGGKGGGAGGTDRMMCYTNEEDRVRYPLVPIRRETAYYLNIHFNAPYIWGMGELEVVYPETILYRDGI